MLRLISRILLIAGTVSLVWLVYGLLSGDPIPNYVIIGVLLFISEFCLRAGDPCSRGRKLTCLLNAERRTNTSPGSQRASKVQKAVILYRN